MMEQAQEGEAYAEVIEAENAALKDDLVGAKSELEFIRPYGDCMDASNEIERLRKELDALKAQLAESNFDRNLAQLEALKQPSDEAVKAILQELAGEASMCWVPKPGDAIFDSTSALEAVNRALEALAKIRKVG